MTSSATKNDTSRGTDHDEQLLSDNPISKKIEEKSEAKKKKKERGGGFFANLFKRDKKSYTEKNTVTSEQHPLSTSTGP